ncbi:CBO0543 family protein [Virgibacillus halophilus]|uniref:CBO0543 family protein n=1 Tax=Tigheibacillus halophilus TaxID=361280 RepID=A0ABU5C5S1_9BACI|nr:CBO0543 family protein [Virgibacillus halophilus]
MSINDLKEVQELLFKTTYQRWMDDVLFSFNWWFLVVISILPWFIWWKLTDKTRLLEIIVVGFAVFGIATLLDVIGIVFSLWTYGYKIIQMFPPLTPVDMTALPIIYMLIYQWFSKWKTFLIAHVIMAAISTFIFEPLFAWMDIYVLHGWKYIYSFPIYIAMAAGVKWFVQKVIAIQDKKR